MLGRPVFIVQNKINFGPELNRSKERLNLRGIYLFNPRVPWKMEVWEVTSKPFYPPPTPDPTHKHIHNPVVALEMEGEGGGRQLALDTV